MAITLSQLQSSCPCFQVDDIAFLGDKPHDHLTLEKFGVWVTHQEWFQPLLSSLPFKNLPKLLEDPINDRLVGFGCFQLLQEAYAHAKHRLATPSWLQFIPQEIRHLLDCGWFKIEADAYNIVPYTAHTGFGFVVLNDGLIEATDRTFGLHRLAGINQLASLHSPVVSGDALSEHPMKFTHTRYLHSLEVSAGATLIGNRCGLSLQDMTTLRIAAQSHDALTPAGGDTMKPLNPGAFDEDANYQQLFKRPGVLAWLKNCGVCPEKLSLTILGHGLLGNILDIADKLAYTGTDTHHFLARNWPKYFAWENFGDAYDRIQSLLKANPYPCSIWECTEQRNGELVFTDTARLADFLRLRSLMFSILYCNAASRFMEAGLITEVASILYQDGILNPKNLLEMTDNELFEVLNQSFDGYGVFSSITFASKADPRVNLFRTQEEALDFEREVAADNSETMTVFEKGFGASTKCLDTFKVLHKRKVVPFSQACPYESWDIRRIGVDPKPFRVYSYNMAPIFRNKAMCQRLLASRNERITKNQ